MWSSEGPKGSCSLTCLLNRREEWCWLAQDHTLAKSGLESKSFRRPAQGPVFFPFVSRFKVGLRWGCPQCHHPSACGFISTLAGVAGMLWREEQVSSGPFPRGSSGALGELPPWGDEDPSKTVRVLCAGADFDSPCGRLAGQFCTSHLTSLSPNFFTCK